jgi:hypothetical protein
LSRGGVRGRTGVQMEWGGEGMRGGRWQEASYPACAEGARRGGVDCSGRGRGHSQPLGLAAAARRGRSLRGLDPHTPWPRAAAAAAAK